jgi:hypothetical protein
MIIFFTASKKAKPEKQGIYDKIVKMIKSFDNRVISLEEQTYSDLLDMDKAKKKEKKISIHNQFIRKAVELSDAAVFEASRYSFKLGQEVQMALDKNIPVLCLSDERDYSVKVQDPNFYSAVYHSEEGIRKEISNFFDQVKSKHLNKRINVFLHNNHTNYLDWYVASHPGTNRSEIIRDAIEDLMEGDNEYKNR